jgi:hypothetical protein
VIGTLKIFDKDSGAVLVKKRNAIHPGNMAYVIASALAGQSTSINDGGSTPSINWMAFGNGGSSSTTTLSYRSPRLFGYYDELPITSSTSTLYAKQYQQQTNNKVYFPGQDMDNGTTVPENTAKINFNVEVSHTNYEAMLQEINPSLTLPTTDSSTDEESVKFFTFDEIGLMSGVTNNGEMLEDKTLMLTHVTFHPVLLAANRTIVVDYTITIQIS